MQVLEGHTDEIFSCAFNHYGNLVITASKDNTLRVRGRGFAYEIGSTGCFCVNKRGVKMRF
jgi:WD40 repeat protein